MRKTILTIYVLVPCIIWGAPKDDFVMTIRSDIVGGTLQTQFTITTQGDGYNYNVDCNDDDVDEATAQNGDYTCDYSNLGGAGTYTIRIKDNNGDGTGFPRFYSSDIPYYDGNNNVRKILSINQWGTGYWTSMSHAFAFASNIQITAWDIPNLSLVTDMSSMFHGAQYANPNVSDWDVSSVEDMSGMFYLAKYAVPDVSRWDVSSVKDMSGMFYFAQSANPDVSNWNVSSVQNMSGMFYYAQSASPDVEYWDVSSVKDMSDMFRYTPSARPDVTHWDVSSVTDMSNMFHSAESAIPDVSHWNVSSVTDMSGMFFSATSATPDVGNWDVSSVTDMSYMFYHATSAIPDMSEWDISLVTNMSWMLVGVTLPTPYYDATLIAWNKQSLQPGVYFNAGNSEYCLAENPRVKIIENNSWNIIDKGKARNCPTNFNDENSVDLKPNGLGQVLLHPYYTVRNFLDTLITIVNTSDQTKALKVRFREGKNARSVFDFNLYLGAHDVWSAALVATDSIRVDDSGERTVKILTFDNACTVPAIYGQEFVTLGFTEDGSGNAIQRAQQGYIEIIEMGTLVDSNELAAGVPISCATVINNWVSDKSKWFLDPVFNRANPDGSSGIRGSVSLIYLNDSIDIPYDLMPIKRFNAGFIYTDPVIYSDE